MSEQYTKIALTGFDGEPEEDSYYLFEEAVEATVGSDLGGMAWDSQQGLLLYVVTAQAGAAVEMLRPLIREHFGEGITLAPPEDVGDPAAWRERWRESFQPLEAGKFWIAPPWLSDQQPKGSDLIPIIIEPEMAFGTGQHATTRLCVRAMSELADIIEGARIVDVGSGSAILSIAAAKLGAEVPIYATEIDPDAEKNAHENWVANGLPAKALDYRVQATLPEEWHATADLIICNMLIERMKPLFQSISEISKITGTILISGYLYGERGELAEELTSLGLSKKNNWEEGEWCASTWTNKN